MIQRPSKTNLGVSFLIKKTICSKRLDSLPTYILFLMCYTVTTSDSNATAISPKTTDNPIDLVR